VSVSLFQGVNVVSIAVPDLAEAREFYRDILELGPPLYDLPEAGWVEFATGSPGGNLSVVQAEEDWEPSHSTTIVFNTEDCFRSAGTLRERGVKCEEPQVFPGYVTFCSFYDPFGNRLQMASPAPDQ
jgi:predicted enzyme related to lactoylglutathione lyase